jgi:hypothetical protein
MLQVSHIKRHYDPERKVTDFLVTFIIDRHIKVAKTSHPGDVSSLSPTCMYELQAAATTGQAA